MTSLLFAKKSKANPPEAGKPQNIEYRMTNSEGKTRIFLTSSFEIPCSTFDIHLVQNIPMAHSSCSLVGTNGWDGNQALDFWLEL
jgi:hypothetical protein